MQDGYVGRGPKISRVLCKGKCDDLLSFGVRLVVARQQASRYDYLEVEL